jgi:hypothetical protein
MWDFDVSSSYFFMAIGIAALACEASLSQLRKGRFKVAGM